MSCFVVVGWGVTKFSEECANVGSLQRLYLSGKVLGINVPETTSLFRRDNKLNARVGSVSSAAFALQSGKFGFNCRPQERFFSRTFYEFRFLQATAILAWH